MRVVGESLGILVVVGEGGVEVRICRKCEG